MQRPPSAELPLEHSGALETWLGKPRLSASQKTRVVSAPLPHAAPRPLLWSLSHGRPPSSITWPAPLTQVLSITGPLGGTTVTESPGGQTRLSSCSQGLATAVPTSQQRTLRLRDTELRPTAAQLTTVRQSFDPCTLTSEFSAA